MIRYSHISKSFGKNAVLEDVSLTLDSPGFYALLGPNGSGKTTLMKSTLGLVHPDAGTIEWKGQPLQGDEYRSQLAYLPQIARFPENLTAAEFFKLIENVRGYAQRKHQLVERFGVNSFIDKPLRALSGGMRQKVNIVGSLMYDTPLLLLDEPTIGLDPVALIELKNFLREEEESGKYILVTTHILHFVEEMAKQVIFILDGRVYFRGTPEELCASTQETQMENAIAHILQAQDHA